MTGTYYPVRGKSYRQCKVFKARQYDVWRDDQQSRLIESMMLNIPIPAFYIDAVDDEKWIVIDGLQRLNTIYRFVIKN